MPSSDRSTCLRTHTLSRLELPDHMTVSTIREKEGTIYKAKLSPNFKVLDPEPEPEPEPGASSISLFQD